MDNDIIIQEANTDFIPGIVLLTGELGYSATEEEIESRLYEITGSGNDKIFVSLNGNGEITGWIHIFGALRLESEPFAEIGGLVVRSGFRKKGIGRELVRTAEKWAREKGFKKIRVRSRTVRKDAHRFYLGKGYDLIKEQAVFDKKL